MRYRRTSPRLPDEVAVNPLFARQGERRVPRYSLGTDEMLPETAYQVIHDEILLDGNARQNLATFVTTWMEREADQLYAEAADKNLVDKDEYPLTAAIENRCVHIIANLWHAPDSHAALGTSTVGSSEACMLSGLALKRRWQHARAAEGKPADRPNIVFSSAVQVVWEKFANYWEVEPRYVPVTAERPSLTPDGVLDAVDENTIGVVAILGVTYTGAYEPVADIAAALDDLHDRTGLDVPVHVDAASGGFVAPFLHPTLRWDFRLNRVHSINASGHKYGLVYPGVGWAVWRTTEFVPQELVFKVAYLGGEESTFNLNFSRPGAQVLLQYYNFLRLGRRGFTRVQQASHDVAGTIAHGLAAMKAFEVMWPGADLPVVCWRLADGHTGNWDLYDLSNRLRGRGWMVPAYPLPKNREDVVVMRIVVRNGLSGDLAQLLLDDVADAVKFLDRLREWLPSEGRTTSSFHH
ncbi:glutamate decarboxylase [Actinopolymorpha cephalotaxi]|uniref:Glutamate decarboxylase n=1 Tax=Actinopolymorpha cephalotaxi TaxID=504797 RepID=A0A1I3BNA9_9ACTN|nr:glutamate decarboxylase [Actinopolymorpha cephalotaxi]NYH82860.1 glutamate decarboxylase [Actinopolymorpha cephalotaxi]SFH63271.1 glutamate decarboxylase [Actinopolymorpha cephalotaxi]